MLNKDLYTTEIYIALGPRATLAAQHIWRSSDQPNDGPSVATT